MHTKKHKRKMNHVVIVTSDASEAEVKEYRIRPWVMQVMVFVICVLIGALAGFLIHEQQVWEAVNQRNDAQVATMKQLTNEKEELILQNQQLNTRISEMDEQIQILSDTVNQKVASEKELQEKLDRQSLPTEFPLNGSATMEEATDENLICVFTASLGTTVVATANGTVISVKDDEDYGHVIRVDHGNGYVSIYRNKGDATVKAGDSVVQGSTLFIIGEDNDKLGYQMQKDGTYINPMDMLSISG